MDSEHYMYTYMCVCVLVYIKEAFGALLPSFVPPRILSQENSGSEGLPHHVVAATSAGRSDVINNRQLKYLITAENTASEHVARF